MGALPIIAFVLLVVVLVVGGDIIWALLEDLLRFIFRRRNKEPDPREPGEKTSAPATIPLAPGTIVKTVCPRRPAGVVIHDGTEYEARCEIGYVSAHTSVRVIRVEGTVAIVRECRDADDPTR